MLMLISGYGDEAKKRVEINVPNASSFEIGADLGGVKE